MTISRLRHRVGGATLAVALGLGLVSAGEGFAAAEAPRQVPAGSALKIVAPGPASVIATTRLRAARSAVVPARVRVGRNLRRVSLRLNGRKVSSRPAVGRVLVARLSAADGLRPGVNRLRVEATRRRAKVPVNAVSQFTVTYPSARLIRLSPIATRGGKTAVTPRLRVPASGVSSHVDRSQRQQCHHGACPAGRGGPLQAPGAVRGERAAPGAQHGHRAGRDARRPGADRAQGVRARSATQPRRPPVARRRACRPPGASGCRLVTGRHGPTGPDADALVAAPPAGRQPKHDLGARPACDLHSRRARQVPDPGHGRHRRGGRAPPR